MWKRDSGGENLETAHLGRQEIIILFQVTRGIFEP